MSQLVLNDISVRFGGVQALTEVGFSLGGGEVVGLIGPNGAGKTTIFNVITGVYRPSSGTVSFGGADLAGMRPHQRLAMGLARTFQNIRLFGQMTALENVMIARHARSAATIFASILRLPSQRAEEREVRERSMQALAFMNLERHADVAAANLPYGLQRRLEIARALASEPRAILLDEPAAGLNPAESAVLVKDIARIAGKGISVLLVEHDMKVVMGISTRIVVLDHGVMIATGEPAAIQKDPRVIEAYLGQPAEA